MRLDDNLELWKPGNNLTRFLKYYKYLSDLADRNIGLIDVKYDMLRAFDPEVSELYSYPALFDMVDKVGASVIHLTRNPFQIYVSHRLCVETSVFHLKIGAERQLFDKISRHSISIDIQDMIEYIGKRLEEQADINHYVKFCTHRLSVDYKDLYIENEGMNLDLLWKFMGLAPQECTPELVKSVQKPYSEIIANYGSVVQALNDFGWSDLL